MSQHGSGADAPSSSSPGHNTPPTIKVCCGDAQGTYQLTTGKVLVEVSPKPSEKDKEVSPAEFEKLGGRGSTKKWKTSIRILHTDGSAGGSLGDWLEKHAKNSSPSQGQKPSNTAPAPRSKRKREKAGPEKSESSSVPAAQRDSKPKRAKKTQRATVDPQVFKVAGQPVHLEALFQVVHELGGLARVHAENAWSLVADRLGIEATHAHVLERLYGSKLQQSERPQTDGAQQPSPSSANAADRTTGVLPPYGTAEHLAVPRDHQAVASLQLPQHQPRHPQQPQLRGASHQGHSADAQLHNHAELIAKRSSNASALTIANSIQPLTSPTLDPLSSPTATKQQQRLSDLADAHEAAVSHSLSGLHRSHPPVLGVNQKAQLAHGQDQVQNLFQLGRQTQPQFQNLAYSAGLPPELTDFCDMEDAEVSKSVVSELRNASAEDLAFILGLGPLSFINKYNYGSSEPRHTVRNESADDAQSLGFTTTGSVGVHPYHMERNQAFLLQQLREPGLQQHRSGQAGSTQQQQVSAQLAIRRRQQQALALQRQQHHQQLLVTQRSRDAAAYGMDMFGLQTDPQAVGLQPSSAYMPASLNRLQRSLLHPHQSDDGHPLHLQRSPVLQDFTDGDRIPTAFQHPLHQEVVLADIRNARAQQLHEAAHWQDTSFEHDQLLLHQSLGPQQSITGNDMQAMRHQGPSAAMLRASALRQQQQHQQRQREQLQLQQHQRRQPAWQQPSQLLGSASQQAEGGERLGGRNTPPAASPVMSPDEQNFAALQPASVREGLQGTLMRPPGAGMLPPRPPARNAALASAMQSSSMHAVGSGGRGMYSDNPMIDSGRSGSAPSGSLAASALEHAELTVQQLHQMQELHAAQAQALASEQTMPEQLTEVQQLQLSLKRAAAVQQQAELTKRLQALRK